MLLSKSTPYSFIKRHLSVWLFQILTRKSFKVFLRCGDEISLGPQIDGIHEAPLTNFINKFADEGFSDFMIDIGANIGLTSCQNGNKFKKIYCFEPNPMCVNILKTNLEISLSESVSEVFDFALGEKDGDCDLFVPRLNWGGAFIRHGNDYPEEVLSKKDGYESINEENYIVNKVKVRNSVEVFKNLFASILADNLNKGIIKIDVEGYERKVLLSISKILPPDISVIVVFENWDPMFNLNEIKDSFKNRKVNFFKFERSIKGTSKSKLRKLLEYIFFGEIISLTDIKGSEVIVGEIVIRLE